MAAANPASVLTARGPLFRAAAVIRDQLEATFPPARFHHALLPAAMSRELWLTLVRRTPFIGLTWLGAQPSASSGRQFRATATWRVVLVNNNPNPGARMIGDAAGIGQFAMVQAAIAVLHGHTPPPVDGVDDIGTLMVTEVTALTTEEWGRADDAVAGLVVAAEFAMTDAEALPELLRLRGGLSFDGADGIAAPVDQDLLRPAGNTLDRFVLDYDRLG